WIPLAIVQSRRLFAAENFQPVKPSSVAIGFFDCRIHYLAHDRRDIGGDTVALDKRDDRMVGHVQRSIGIYRNLCAALGSGVVHGFVAAKGKGGGRVEVTAIVASIGICAGACAHATPARYSRWAVRNL